MPRQYRHIEQYADEILRLKSEGKTRAEIGAKLDFSKKQIHNFVSRHNEKQRTFLQQRTNTYKKQN